MNRELNVLTRYVETWKDCHESSDVLHALRDELLAIVRAGYSLSIKSNLMSACHRHGDRIPKALHERHDEAQLDFEVAEAALRRAIRRELSHTGEFDEEGGGG